MFFVYPETAHATLEQLSQVFGDTSVLDPEKAGTVIPQYTSGTTRSTTTSGETDTDKPLLVSQDKLAVTRASSSST